MASPVLKRGDIIRYEQEAADFSDFADSDFANMPLSASKEQERLGLVHKNKSSEKQDEDADLPSSDYPGDDVPLAISVSRNRSSPSGVGTGA